MTVNDMIRSLEILKASGWGDATLLIDAGGLCYEPWTAVACDDIWADENGPTRSAIILSDVRPDVIMPE